MSEGDVQPPTMKVAEAHNIGEKPNGLGTVNANRTPF